MLNIPSSVITLFKQDGVFKNFRVHFPNGELADLTNDNVVQESVKFSESICSQDVFKFGLTEASVIEFETVGVANMYGMDIECSCEIDCSSLSAADKATIAAGTWDGAWDGVNAVFSVPYGTFRVESCPRDHQAMAHRKVTAYTENIKTEGLYETQKMELFTNVSQYKPDLENVFFSAALGRTPSELVNHGYTRTALTYQSTKEMLISDPLRGNLIIHFSDDSTKRLQVFAKYYTPISPNSSAELDFSDRAGTDTGGIFAVENASGTTNLPSIVDASVRNDLATALQNSAELQSYDPTLDGYGGFDDLVDDLISKVVPRLYSSFMEYRTSFYGGSYTAYNGIPILGNTAIYPYYPSKLKVQSGVTGYAFIMPQIVTGFAVYHVPTNPLLPRELIAEVQTASPGTCYLYEHTATPALSVTFESTLQTKRTSDGNRLWYSFSNAYSILDTVEGLLELRALFMTADRLGGNKLLRIDNTSPTAIIPGEYSQMWWDEYNVEPIGTVRYSYTDEAGEEQIANYEFGDGASVYDMTDNEALKMMEGADPATIEAMLDANFIPYINAVNFVPIDLQMKGLPYIEAGDALSVTAQDATVCNSFALRHEISGIQALAAQIDSESGLIIESGEGS